MERRWRLTNMGLVKRKNGSYALEHNTKKARKGDCEECGENPGVRKGLNKKRPADVELVKEHIEDHLNFFSIHKSITPMWCKTCGCLIEHKLDLDYKKVYKRDLKGNV